MARTVTGSDGGWRLDRTLSPGRVALVARVPGDATNAAGQSAVRPAVVR